MVWIRKILFSVFIFGRFSITGLLQVLFIIKIGFLFPLTFIELTLVKLNYNFDKHAKFIDKYHYISTNKAFGQKIYVKTRRFFEVFFEGFLKQSKIPVER